MKIENYVVITADGVNHFFADWKAASDFAQVNKTDKFFSLI